MQGPGPRLVPPSLPSRPPAPGNERAAPGEESRAAEHGAGGAVGGGGGSCVAAGEGTGNCPPGLEDPRRDYAGREPGVAALGALRVVSQAHPPSLPDPSPRDTAPH